MTDYSDKVLEAVPVRATRFLTGLGAEPTVRTLLAKVGMSDKDIEEGRTLLLACLAMPNPRSGQLDSTESRVQREAVAEIDQWDEPTFGRARAALERFFPGAASYLFADGLQAARGVESVRAVATFLARLTALEKGSDPARAASLTEDRKAVDLLAVRGLTLEERERVEKLVQIALGPTPVAASAEPESPVRPAERRAKLEALKRWYDDWATTAHTVVRKRNELIRLGLAERRSARDEGEDRVAAPRVGATPTTPSPTTAGGSAAAQR